MNSVPPSFVCMFPSAGSHSHFSVNQCHPVPFLEHTMEENVCLPEEGAQSLCDQVGEFHQKWRGRVYPESL